MSNPRKTPSGFKPFNGAEDGVPFTKDNQPSPEAKSAGRQRYKAYQELKRDVAEQFCEGEGGVNAMVEAIKTKILEGDVKAGLDLLKIITPKDIDIKSDGKEMKTTNIIVNTQLKED